MEKLEKEIGRILIDFEKNVNQEKNEGKKAVILIMAINDIEAIIKRKTTSNNK